MYFIYVSIYIKSVQSHIVQSVAFDTLFLQRIALLKSMLSMLGGLIAAIESIPPLVASFAIESDSKVDGMRAIISKSGLSFRKIFTPAKLYFLLWQQSREKT